MAEIFLFIALWVALLGLIVFCVLFIWLAEPWRDNMGRHILFFMGGLTLAFAYGTISKEFEPTIRTQIWSVILGVIAGLVWWRVVILIKLQIQARK